MNIKSFFANEEGRLSIIRRYELPEEQVQTPIIFEHGVMTSTTNIPMSPADLLQCIDNGLILCQKFSANANLFDTSFRAYFPGLECYWDVGKVNMFRSMVVNQEVDVGMRRSVARQIYNSFVDDHYHTVARRHTSPRVAVGDKYLVLGIHELDMIPFDAQKIELVLPLIGIGTYFSRVPNGLTLVTVTVPRSNCLPLDIITKRVQYCSTLPDGCRVEVDVV